MDEYILGIGGANYDLHVKSEEKLKLSDSNPSRFEHSAGGVGRNIIENLSRLGNKCRYLSAFGDDEMGRTVQGSLENVGVKTDGSYISKEFPTSSYLDIIDDDGDMFIGACDCRVLENAPDSWLSENKELIQGARAIVIDTNLTEEQISQILCMAENINVYADPVSCAKAKRLIPFLHYLYFIKPNANELSVLSGMPCENELDITRASEELLNIGVKKIAVSLGKKGCYYADAWGKRFFAHDNEIPNMVNATGAGDAFTAGFIHANLKYIEEPGVVAFALKCGSMAVMSKETVNPEIAKLTEIYSAMEMFTKQH